MRFGNNPGNIWEVKKNGKEDKMTAIYRGRLSTVSGTIDDVVIDERRYRLWKTFTNHNDGTTHMPDVFPLIYHMYSQGYEVLTRIRDSKYTFERISTA